jgi:hypothetical protein
VRNTVLILWVIVLGAGAPLRAPGAEPSATQAEFFEQKIRPLLSSRCFECHGPKKHKGGLRLDSRASILEGGDSGPALVPGKPEESRLIEAIGYSDDLKMPPKGKLPSQEIEVLTNWVKQGAPWSDRESVEPSAAPASNAPATGPLFRPDQKAFWAFQPLKDPPVPSVRRADWPRTPIDRFVLAELEKQGLSPAPQADKRTLIRRATFDLTGLPPTPEEIHAFLEDQSPEAFARVVDRLLGSPGYGVRWGRHWLDLARYADSNGMDENVAYANAFRYRDYIVDAFNQDKPYDQFVHEQLAADLLPSSGDEQRDLQRLVATGYLVIGPKMLAEDDQVKMEMDIIDEQVDTIGRTFLGLTLGCARCHDHKFDPIPTADYYSLAGILKSTKAMDNFKVVARWHERPLASQAQRAEAEVYRRKIADRRADIAFYERDALGALDPASLVTYLKPLYDDLNSLERSKPVIPEAMSVEDQKPQDLRIHIRGNHLTLGPEVPRQFPRIIAGESQTPIKSGGSGRLQLARWLTSPDHPLTSRVMVNRIWYWHFGQGLVRSIDNFGRLGERPTNPALLDWLARRFLAEGWSIKALHRLIMLSSTYQMSTTYDETAAQADPENRLHWRMPRRRLEAEEIRDAILAVSGQIDLAQGGTLLSAKNHAYVYSTVAAEAAPYDNRRRSIYQPVFRSGLYDVFQTFDFADPSASNGARDSTTVAPQALFMLNSSVVLEHSRHFAQSLLDRPARDDCERLALLYETAYGRLPSAAETERALDFLKEYEQALESRPEDPSKRRTLAWGGLCRAVIGASEFIYLE